MHPTEWISREDARPGLGLNRGDQSGQLIKPAPQLIDFILHVQDAANALKIDALILGEPLNQTQPRDVACRVAPAPLGRASRRDEPHPVVGSQRLRVHPSEVGCNRDDEDGRVMIDSLRQL
jgi:hypothetical protein